MDFHPVLTGHLDALTGALEGGTDLEAILSVLVDDLTAAVPSFLGLHLSLVVDGTPTTLTTLDAALGNAVRASLLLPLAAIGEMSPQSSIVYYAGTAGAFTRLAADSSDVYDFDGQVVLDGHLKPAATRPGVGGLAELSTANQAVGILIDQGHSPEGARVELRRRADDSHRTQQQIAEQLISQIAHRNADSGSGSDPP